MLLARDIDAPRKALLLKGLIRALCGSADDSSCIIKFTSWNLLFLEQILALFPTTPWAFIYRAPTEVVQSLTARSPTWAANQELRRIVDTAPGTGAAYPIAILERVFAAPLAHLDRRALVIDYRQLPDAIPTIAAHFGLPLGPAERERVARMGQYDSKQKGQVAFRAREPVALPDALRHTMAPLDSLYKQWEQISARQARTEPGAATSDQASIALKTALQDRRIAELIEAGKIPRLGALDAAAAEYARLHASGAATLLHAVLNQENAPARLPESAFAPAPFVLFDDFFDGAANQALLDYAVSKQALFTQTEAGTADGFGRPARTNLVTYDVGDHGAAMRAIQLKLGAYAHGDYFNAHQDNGKNHRDRLLSFVYYFHDDPKPCQGGDLLLYDGRFSPRAYVRSLFTRIIPRNNSIIFFPSEYFHEVSAVVSGNRDFRSSRFTLAGHVL